MWRSLFTPAAAASVLASPAFVQPIAGALPGGDAFDCTSDYWDCEAAWTAAQKDYCYNSRGRACPAPVTLLRGAAAGATDGREALPLAPQPEPPDALPDWERRVLVQPSDQDSRAPRRPAQESQQERNASAHKSESGSDACETACLYKGERHTCAERVRWSALHEFEGEEACARSLQKVQQECAESCAACAVSAVRCEAYDCENATAAHRAKWSKAQSDFCCKHRRVGCAGGNVTAAAAESDDVAPSGFDCEIGVLHWKSAWSGAKKAWCCERHDLGCEPPRDGGGNSSDHRAGSHSGGGDENKTRADGGGLTGGAHGHGDAFNCSANLSSWETDWSEEKRKECCKKEDRGCGRFDCKADLADWKQQWPAAKRIWCCQRHFLGCDGNASTTEAAAFDCDSNRTSPVSGWPEERRHWCCAHRQVACPSTTTPPSAPKKDRAKHKPKEAHKANKDSATAASASATAGEAAVKWYPPAKSSATQKVKWYTSSTTAPPYDCYRKDPKEWHSDHLQWCCQHRQVCADGTSGDAGVADEAPTHDASPTVTPARGAKSGLSEWHVQQKFKSDDGRASVLSRSKASILVMCCALCALVAAVGAWQAGRMRMWWNSSSRPGSPASLQRKRAHEDYSEGVLVCTESVDTHI